MTAESRRGVLLAIVGLLIGLGVVAALVAGGVLAPRGDVLARLRGAPAADAPTAGGDGTGEATGEATRAAALPSLAARTPEGTSPALGAGAGTAGGGNSAAAGASGSPPGAPAASAAGTASGIASSPSSPTKSPVPPSFDVVRVEPSGEAVIAGRAAPGATVELLRGGEPFARVLADSSGMFAAVPPPLPTGTSEIALRALGPDGTPTLSREGVVVDVAPRRDAAPLVALTAPDRATVVLSRPDAPGTPAAALGAGRATAPGTVPPPGVAASGASAALGARPGSPAPSSRDAGGLAGDPAKALRVVGVEAEEGGRLYVSGQAQPGASVRLYLNDTLVAPGSAGADGRVAFSIGRGVRPGDYRVRLDQVDPVTGAVRARAEVAFTYPATMPRVAEASPAPSGRPAPSEGTTARALPQGAPAAPSARGAPGGALPQGATGAIAQAPTAQAPTAPGIAASGAPAPGPAAPGRAPASGPAPGEASVASRAQSAAGAPSTAGASSLSASSSNASSSNASSPGVPAKGTPSTGASSPGASAPASTASGAPAGTEADRPARAATADGRPAGGRTTLAGTPAPAGGATSGDPGGGTGLGGGSGGVFIPEIGTATVARGDNLWRISRKVYGRGPRYTVIYDANQGQIRNPELIYPGQVFVLPADPAGAAPSVRAAGGGPADVVPR